MSTPVLEFRGVCLGRAPQEGVRLTQGIDWKVNPGDRWVITGAHESGKTTLLETAAGLRAPLEGEIRWFGEPVAPGETAAVAWRKRLGLVFDGGGRLFAQLSVAENIALPVAYHGNLPLAEAVREITPLLESFDLGAVATTGPSRLNRGTARRVALARALALKPELLLIDDPNAGADPVQARACRHLLADIALGHPWLEGRPITLIIAAPELRPWLGLGRQFGLVHAAGWRTFDSPEQLMESDDTTIIKLVAEDTHVFRRPAG